jgi:GT2 family glycosyltransferase
MKAYKRGPASSRALTGEPAASQPGESTSHAPSTPATGVASDGTLVSVVVTVYNEARHIRDLLDSLVVQEPPFEVLIVDADSTDGTQAIVRRYEDRYKNVRLIRHPGKRGESRNAGVTEAAGEAVAFIDGDCIANPFWLKTLRHQLTDSDIVAGHTIQIGYWAFEALDRVELRHKGLDVTHPSCNLAFKKTVFEKIGGFDDRFHTAEDIDLNYRAVDVGATLKHAPEAIVYHRARDTFTKFFQQAYWNGYGRKQLTLKHGNLWGAYSFRKMLKTQASFWGLSRLAVASLGYAVATVKEDRLRVGT